MHRGRHTNFLVGFLPKRERNRILGKTLDNPNGRTFYKQLACVVFITAYQERQRGTEATLPNEETEDTWPPSAMCALELDPTKDKAGTMGTISKGTVD